MKRLAVKADTYEQFMADFRAVFEHSPWVAERAWKYRPFATVQVLHERMLQVVREARRPEQLTLIRAHPELAGREAITGSLTSASTGEQGRLGFTALTRTELEKIAELNGAYREKFDFPCIVALRLHQNRATVLEEMARRLLNDAESEVSAALEQIGHIARGRLEKLLGGD